MAEIKAFKGIRYNQTLFAQKKIKLEDVVTQPYDKITKEMQDAYYEKSPYNIARIILGKGEKPYDEASAFFNEWQDKGILLKDEEPSIYPYWQEYDFQGKTKTRKGFVALLKLEEFASGVVIPHERTLSGPKEDRLKLLKSTCANFGQIFMLYSDPEHKISTLIDKEISEVAPLADITESYEKGVRHKLWRVRDESIIKEVQELMKDKTLLIADGHHRYETALNYRKLRLLKDANGAKDANYRMVTFVGMEDPGLMILPTHRAIYGVNTEAFIHRVSSYFVAEECKNKDELLSKLEGKHHQYGLYDGRFWWLRLRDENLIEKFVSKEKSKDYKKLDIVVLHKIVFEGVLNISEDKILSKECIDYLRDIDDGIQGVNSCKYELFFILNPTCMEEVQKCSAHQESMPQKSTDFYPKLITGLVINKL